MGHYALVGKPYGADRVTLEKATKESLDDLEPGHEFEANLSDEDEQALVDAGALRVLPAKRSSHKK